VSRDKALGILACNDYGWFQPGIEIYADPHVNCSTCNEAQQTLYYETTVTVEVGVEGDGFSLGVSTGHNYTQFSDKLQVLTRFDNVSSEQKSTPEQHFVAVIHPRKAYNRNERRRDTY
jgi:hypothetical protein